MTIGFKKINIFTPLLVIAVFAFAFRLMNIVTFHGTDAGEIGAVLPAAAESAAPAAPANKEATKEEVDKSVQAAAQDTKGQDEHTPAVKKDMEAAAEKMPPMFSSETRSYSTSEIEVLQSLSKRRGELDKREQSLAQKEALLTAARQEIDRKVEELNKLKVEMVSLIGKQQTLEDERIKSLVKIYEGMKPKEAAAIFNTLDMSVLLPVVIHMKESKTAPILASMDTDKARLVTTKLAEQRKLPDAKEDAPPDSTVKQ